MTYIVADAELNTHKHSRFTAIQGSLESAKEPSDKRRFSQYKPYDNIHNLASQVHESGIFPSLIHQKNLRSTKLPDL